MSLIPEIQKEWVEGSGVDPELTTLNVVSISGQAPYERLLYNWDSSKVHPDATWREINRRFGDNWGHGGWWCSGVDVLTGEDSSWGCFKPNKPRTDKSKGFDPNKPKLIKYEHPIKTSTEIFALRVPRHIWEKVSSRYNVPMGNYIHFWEWVKDHPEIPLSITEGVKKAGALLTNGYVAIALPGVRNGYRQPRDEFGNKTGQAYLIPQLKAFAQPGRELYLVFDQDTKQRTVRDVNRAISATAKLLAKERCKVKIVVWHPELGKGVDDLVVTRGIEVIHQAFEAALPCEIWGVVQLVKLTYPVDLEIDYEKITEEVEPEKYRARFSPPPGYQLICLKSPKNTGKTEWLAQLVEPLIKSGGKVLLLTHRIQLGEELCKRLGIDYVTELKDSETGGLWGYGLCVDSLHPKSQAHFNPEDWEGAYIIIDEAEQVIWHLLNSSTCQSERVAILRCLKQVIQFSLSTGGKIFLSDADLCDISIDYIRSLAGYDLKPWVACNNWKPEQGWLITNFDGNNPSQLVADLEKHIEQGGIPFVCVSGQKKKSQWGTQNLEAYLRRRFPSKRILRIDRESISDPEHPAYGCMAHLNELLPNYDIVLVSPTIETGVSINLKDHFTSVWGIFQGVQTCDSVRQALARVRAKVPRYIWIRKTGFSRVGNGSTSINALLASQHNLAKANVNLLAQADFTEDIDLDFQPESLHAWAKKAVAVNLGMANYRATILEALVNEGHTVIEPDNLDEAAGELTKDTVKETKDSECQAHYSAVAEVENDASKHDDLKDKRAKTYTERLQFEKGEIERRYHVPVTPELVEKDAKGWHSQIRLHYYLTVGRQHLLAREANVARKQLEAGDGAVFKPDFNKRQIGAKIWILDTIGFDKLMQRQELSADDPELLSITDYCKQHAFEIKAATGVTISQKDSSMAIAQLLVGLIGYRFPYLRREGSRGSQVRVYGAAAADFLRDDKGEIIINDQGQATPIADGREDVFAAWLEKDVAASQTAAATVEQKEGGVTLDQQNVSELDTVVRGNKDLDLIEGDYRGGVTTEGVTTKSNRLADLVAMLSDAEDARTFLALIEGYSSEMVEDAIDLQDSQHRRQELEGWLQALSVVTETASPERPPISSYREGDEVWFYNHQSEAKWLRGTVEKVGHGFVRCMSGFLGALIERSQEIAPGSWVFNL